MIIMGGLVLFTTIMYMYTVIQYHTYLTMCPPPPPPPPPPRHIDHRALDGGEDGMCVIRKLLRVSQTLLKPGG